VKYSIEKKTWSVSMKVKRESRVKLGPVGRALTYGARGPRIDPCSCHV